MNHSERWNRCDECGRFVGFRDFENGAAARWEDTPDSQFSTEQYRTLCVKHNQELKGAVKYVNDWYKKELTKP